LAAQPVPAIRYGSRVEMLGIMKGYIDGPTGS